jgi:hypothetical protein
MALSDGSWRMAGGGGKRLEAILASEVANETADKLNGSDSTEVEEVVAAAGAATGTGEGTGEGDGDGDKESVRREEEAAALRPISSMANRPWVTAGPPVKSKQNKNLLVKLKETTG